MLKKNNWKKKYDHAHVHACMYYIIAVTRHSYLELSCLLLISLELFIYLFFSYIRIKKYISIFVI